MKRTRLMKIFAATAACAIALGTAFAQTGTTTTTTSLDGTGTITTYTPGSEYITMRTETSAEPVKYYYSKTTTIVDPDGRPVEWSALRPDMPVRYSYVNEGGRMVISKVTLAKPISAYATTTTSPDVEERTAVTTTSTATTNSAGTIVSYSPGADYIQFRGESGSAPVKYYYSKNTTVVGHDGRALTMSALRPDMPARVHYVNEGGRMVVSKVELTKAAAPVEVIKKETTTTTTTTSP